jgi:DNA invertase Pin-like site-specific DNA recombinase
VKNKVTIAYLRVSTLDQNTDLQESEVKAYLAQRDWLVDSVFLRDQESGLKDSRVAYSELLRLCRTNKVTRIVVWKLDRFSRSLKSLVWALHELNELGVQFVSIRDNFDFCSPSGRLLAHLLGAFAEFEASLIRERVIAGLKHAKAKGKTLGRPKIGIESDQVEELSNAGLRIRNISKELKMSRSVVHRALSQKRILNQRKNTE